MSEIGEQYAAMTEARKTARWQRSALLIQQLNKHHLVYKLDNGTLDAVITTKGGLIDFWTTTGRWFDRRAQKYGNGVDDLMARIQAGEVGRTEEMEEQDDKN